MEKGEAMQPDTTPNGAGALSREELIAMAREADPFGDDGRLMSLAMLTPGTLERFAALVAARERALRDWAFARAALSAQAHEAAPTMDDAIAAGDGTLHGAIDHWMNRALDAERVLLSRGLVLEEAAKVCEEREQRFNREDARAACRLCAKGIRALADQINAAIGAAKGEPS